MLAVAVAAEVNGSSCDPKELDCRSFQTICCYDVRCSGLLKILFENVPNEGGVHIFTVRDLVTRFMCDCRVPLHVAEKKLCHICGAFVFEFLAQLSFFIVNVEFILISK